MDVGTRGTCTMMTAADADLVYRKCLITGTGTNPKPGGVLLATTLASYADGGSVVRCAPKVTRDLEPGGRV